ncbi:MAG: response regulator [bacterium]|nr:response regulator [bacterium]
MERYRIMLVDDEEEVRKGIIRKIDWESLGFQVVGDAENGEEALEKIEQLEPEVVMTDIRMPYMDGLTLCSRIRQKYPSIKLLIFSGFDDFDYAQQAIKLNVTEYILKPVNGEELTEILNRVRENLDEEIAQRRNVNLLRESYRNSLPILRELFLNNLVQGNLTEANLAEKLQEYEIDLLGARKWLTAVIDVKSMELGSALFLHQEQELIPISVRQLFEDNLRKYCRFTSFNSTAGLVLIAAVDEENSQTGFIDLLGDVCKECKRILAVTVTVGLGHSCSKLEELSLSYQDALDALGYREIAGSGKVICISDMEPLSRGKLQLETKDEADLVSAVKFGTPEKIEAVIQGLTAHMEDVKVHMRQYQIYQMSILNCLIRLMQQYDLNVDAMFDKEESYTKLVTGVGKPEEFAALTIPIAKRMNEAMNRERDKATKKVILEAKQYIQENYANPDLSVDLLCRQLHMSPAYFSTLFKRETGQTCIAYLTEVRMEKAVELLNRTEDKTYVIAQKVGYPEQNYFSYVFKKRFGVSPTKFRK